MKRISWTFFLSLLLVVSINSQFAFGEYPTIPNASATPGTLCKNASELRYPEKIKYCNRNVSTGLKKQVIAMYENKLGFEIMKYGRENFKIDHLIPLCAGGSNDITNLWPQHKSVYAITDPLEQPLCQRMQEGKLRQADAVRLILHAKHDLNSVDEILDQLQSL